MHFFKEFQLFRHYNSEFKSQMSRFVKKVFLKNVTFCILPVAIFEISENFLIKYKFKIYIF